MHPILVSDRGFALVTTEGAPDKDVWIGHTVNLTDGTANRSKSKFHVSKPLRKWEWRQATKDELADVRRVLQKALPSLNV
jgi:hypothetical protein